MLLVPANMACIFVGVLHSLLAIYSFFLSIDFPDSGNPVPYTKEIIRTIERNISIFSRDIMVNFKNAKKF